MNAISQGCEEEVCEDTCHHQRVEIKRATVWENWWCPPRILFVRLGRLALTHWEDLRFRASCPNL